jgi:hypothetical protein
MGVGVLAGPEGARVDGTLVSVSEKELGGVSVHVELIIGGDDFETVVNDVLKKMGDPVSLLALWNQLNPRWTPGIRPPGASVCTSLRSSSSRTKARAGMDSSSAISIAARKW